MRTKDEYKEWSTAKHVIVFDTDPRELLRGRSNERVHLEMAVYSIRDEGLLKCFFCTFFLLIAAMPLIKL
jgi:hypothetical protein